MKVLVTGATGFIGGAVAKELAARGHAVRAFMRTYAHIARLKALGMETALGDVLDRASLDRALEGCDGLVHAAAQDSLRLADGEACRRVNVEGMRNVLDAARAARVQRAVYVSGASTIGPSGRQDEVRDESAPHPIQGRHLGLAIARSKVEAEELALAAPARGVPVVVVNPTMVIGPIGGGAAPRGQRFIESIPKLLRREIPVYVRGGINLCDIRDVAAGIASALERGRAGERDILGGTNVTLDQLFEEARRLTGLPGPTPIPYALAYVGALASEVGTRLFGDHAASEIHRGAVRLMGRTWFVSSAKAERELGYRPRPFAEMLRDTLEALGVTSDAPSARAGDHLAEPGLSAQPGQQDFLPPAPEAPPSASPGGRGSLEEACA